MRKISRLGQRQSRKKSDPGGGRSASEGSNSQSAEDSELYRGGVPLGASAGDGVADAAISLVFASSSNFISSG